MKNIVKAALLTSAIGLGSCNHNSQESDSDVPVQQTYTSKQIGFQNNAVNAIHSSSEIESNVLKIYGKCYNFPVVNKATASKIHDALMHMTLGQSPQEVQQTICAQKDVKKILDGTPVVSKDETYRYMQSILRQSGLFFEPMVYDKTKSLVAIDSVVKKPIDIVLFKQIF